MPKLILDFKNPGDYTRFVGALQAFGDADDAYSEAPVEDVPQREEALYKTAMVVIDHLWAVLPEHVIDEIESGDLFP